MRRSASLASLCQRWSQGRMAHGQRKTLRLPTPSMTITCRKIRTGRGVQNTSQKTSTTSRDGDRRGKNTFAFGFASAGRIAKIFSGLKSTLALGTDGIPVSVLKMKSDMLARPVSHLVNMSLSAGVFRRPSRRPLYTRYTKEEGRQGTTLGRTG
jgi:hypothetical protein